MGTVGVLWHDLQLVVHTYNADSSAKFIDSPPIPPIWDPQHGDTVQEQPHAIIIGIPARKAQETTMVSNP